MFESIVTKPPSERVNFIKTATKTFYLFLEGKFSFDMIYKGKTTIGIVNILIILEVRTRREI